MVNTRDTMPIACPLAERELALRRAEITATLLSGRQEARAHHPMCTRRASQAPRCGQRGRSP